MRDGPAGDVDHFRAYLLMLARLRLDKRVRAKLDASDVVQQTLLEAHRDANFFRGHSIAAQAAWLRQILARNMVNAVRDLTRDKRDVGREQALQAELDDSAAQLAGWLAAEQSSPSEQAERQERALRVAHALAQLPEHQREAVMRRHLQGHSLAEIADGLGVTAAAVTGLLHRGLKALRLQLDDLGEP